MNHWTAVLAVALGLLLGFAAGLVYARKGDEAIDRCVRNARDGESHTHSIYNGGTQS